VLVVALLVLAAKVPPPPPAHCEDGHLVVQPTYGDIVIGAQGIALRDAKPAPKVAKAAESLRERTLSIKVSDTRAFIVDANGWTLTNGGVVTPLEMPQGAKSADVRNLGVSGKHAWICGQYWLAHVDLETGAVTSGKLARDGYKAVVLDAGDVLMVQNGDRLYRCTPDSVCTETVRLPFTPARYVIGQSGFLFASDASTDKVVRVMRDKLDTAIAVTGGTGAVFCPLTGNFGAMYVPASAWQATRISTEPSEAQQPWLTRDRLLALALLTDTTAGAAKAMFDTALREKWPELDGLGLVATNDARPEVRATVAHAFASVPSTRGFATLWLLGRDSDPSVRSAALDATARWCSKQRVVPCTSALKQYMADPSSDVAWLARDLLLIYDPIAALRDAPAEYRKDAVSHLAALLLTSSNPALHEALVLLTYDTDPSVRTAAWQTLGGMGL
jgi:hypothetical protein